MRRMYSENQLLKAIESESKENGLKVFENIVDKDGHARFIEGDITPIAHDGITYNYYKWSLSGTHLMLVLCGAVANGSAVGGFNVATITLPQWILNKIVPLFGSANNVDRKTFDIFNDDVTSQQVTVYLQKDTESLNMYVNTAAASKDRQFRYQFDLLIDNE